jgi:hypothetical protein
MWTAAERDSLLRGAREFPILSLVWPCLQSQTMKADLWRYLVLFRHGGIYADLDSELLDEAALRRAAGNASALLALDHMGFPSQFFIAVAPGHPLMRMAIECAATRLLRKQDDIGQTSASFFTGPHAVLDALTRLLPGRRIPERALSHRIASLAQFPGRSGGHPHSELARFSIQGTHRLRTGHDVRIGGRGLLAKHRRSRAGALQHHSRDFDASEYHRMNMTHFLTEKRRLHVSCVEVAARQTPGGRDAVEKIVAASRCPQ